MNLLFLHQNFPGQYRELVSWLSGRPGHRIVFLTQRAGVAREGGALTVRQYPSHRVPQKDAYGLSRYFEESTGRGFGVVQACRKLRDDGFRPDIVIGHAGWGETLFVKDVWPDVPVISYFEYFHKSQSALGGFDPEFPDGPDAPFLMRARSAVALVAAEGTDLGQCPTQWQFGTHPAHIRERCYVCHDGIRTDILTPNADASLSLGRLPDPLTRADEVVTYMARNMEPTRGFHVFMRALPHLLEARPKARVVLIGGNASSYGPDSRSGGGFRADMERELGDRVDWTRVHFLGQVPYGDFRRIIQISRCHVYLTVPFVLSWSLLESMAMGATVVASDTAPVREVIRHGENGLLVDYFAPEALARQIAEVLARPEDVAHLGPAARADVAGRYDFLRVALPEHLRRINSLVPRRDHIALPDAEALPGKAAPAATAAAAPRVS